MARHGAVVPSLWHLEVGNSLRMALRRQRIDAAFIAETLQDLVRLRVEVDDQTVPRAWSDTMALAAAHQLTMYDASYLELAVRRGLPVASLDRAMCQAAVAPGVAIA